MQPAGQNLLQKQVRFLDHEQLRGSPQHSLFHRLPSVTDFLPRRRIIRVQVGTALHVVQLLYVSEILSENNVLRFRKWPFGKLRSLSVTYFEIIVSFEGEFGAFSASFLIFSKTLSKGAPEFKNSVNREF